MISLDAKAETSQSKKSSLLSLSGSEVDKKGKHKLSFLELLNGVKLKPKDEALKSIPLKKTLALKELKKETHLPQTLSVELNPILVKDITPKDLKRLILDGKSYLKTKIIQSDAFKLSEAKKLPKTLKGLVAVANKLGIDIKKITLEDVQPTKLTLTDKARLSKQTHLKVGGKFATQKELKEIPKKQEQKSAPALSKLEFQEPSKLQQKTLQVESNHKNKDLKDEVKASVPLFRDVVQIPQKVLTQNIVNIKQHLNAKDNHQGSKTIKQKADETLKLLLRGEKPKQNLTTGLTADFSVASSRVIAPQASKDISKSFESLLQNTDDKSFNLDGLKMQKPDTLSVKLNEAKQMVQNLSQDIKTAIDDYKSPFTRLKVQLNPQNLGEVDLTIVSRGKNLHVNIGSNNIAINALAMNINDLKTQLGNNGINNATFNFNGGSNSDAQSQNSQQNHQNQRQAGKEYNYFEAQDENEEILNSLEIVVPNYA